ncbi:MAG: hypothetical protein PSW75_06025 [bacterium]|nr:hypothetical protein [bacterium]MDI1336701.1 hypothetical protein [Lacunisphaera sp.]
MPRINPFLMLAIWASLAGFAWGGETGTTSGQDWGNLLGNSPFSGAPAGPGLPAPGSLEFRGMVREGEEVWVNLYDPASKRAQWSVVPGSPNSRLVLESYDPATQHLVIVQAGRRLDLALRLAHVVLPADIRPLVVSVTGEAPASGDNEREAFIRQLPPDAREMLEQAQRRRHPRAPDLAAVSAEFTTH